MKMQTKTSISKIVLAQPRGFCAGVNRAIEIVDIALELYGTPLYVRHEIVHNHHVVNDFKSRGVIFVEVLDEVPDGARLVFSAHGTSPEVLERARARGLQFIDAVCPLVTKVHLEIARALKLGKQVVYIGHKGHQEVLGAMGYAEQDRDILLVETVEDVEALLPELKDSPLVVATQTTLSLDDTAKVVAKLKESFTDIEFPKSDDICYATQNRQDAVKELAKIADYILIIGSKNSSNTLRLLELARKLGKQAELVPNPDEFEFNSRHCEDGGRNNPGIVVGISSGASAPEFLVETLVSKLGAKQVETLEYKEEHVEFPLPLELKKINL